MCVWGGGGGTAVAMQVRVSPMSEKQQSPCEGDGGGLNFEREKMLENKTSPHLRKKWAYVPLFFVFFHSSPTQ